MPSTLPGAVSSCNSCTPGGCPTRPCCPTTPCPSHLRLQSTVRDAPPLGDGGNTRCHRRVSPGSGVVDHGGLRRGGTPCGDRLPSQSVSGNGVEPSYRRLRRFAGGADPLHTGSG